MRNLSKKEIMELGKDLNKAKNEVLKKWGFSNEERAKILRTSVSVIDILEAKEEPA